MELRHLRYFHAVARALNFSRAAETLRVAQPALSRQIRDLEDELGVRLFDRNRVRVQLTDAGRTLARHVAKILAEVDIAVDSVRATQRGLGGQLMICNDWRLSFDFIPGTIAKFRALHPRVEIALVDLPSGEQLAALRAGHAHVCFMHREAVPTQAGFKSMLVWKSGIRVVVSRQHRLARRPSVKLAELRDATFIRPIDGDSAEAYTIFVAQACRLAGFTPIFSAKKISSPGGLTAAVGASLGVALLPDPLCQPGNPYVRSLRSDCEAMEIYAVWLSAETSSLLRDYLGILKAFVVAGAKSAGAASG